MKSQNAYVSITSELNPCQDHSKARSVLLICDDDYFVTVCLSGELKTACFLSTFEKAKPIESHAISDGQIAIAKREESRISFRKALDMNRMEHYISSYVELSKRKYREMR